MYSKNDTPSQKDFRAPIEECTSIELKQVIVGTFIVCVIALLLGLCF